MRTGLHLILKAFLIVFAANAFAQDANFHIYLCFGQSNMEGFPGIEEQDKGPVDPRFQMLAAVDFPKQERIKGKWYPAVPPLCRPSAGLGPADHFGRFLVTNLPPQIRVGVVNVSIGGCKIELFGKDTFGAYVATAPKWMTNTIATYAGNPYQHLVDMAKLAQRDGVIKGILLHQGESNTNDREWPNKVKGIYENLLRDLGLKAADVPLIVGELVNADQNGACASMNSIIADLPKTIPTAHVVSSAGCGARRDRLHFTAAGYRELGRRYGEMALSLLGKNGPGAVSPLPAPPAPRTPVPILPALPAVEDKTFYASSGVPHGRVDVVRDPIADGAEKRMHLYLPPGYDANTARRYPVLIMFPEDHSE